jgi:hypothetical protein
MNRMNQNPDQHEPAAKPATMESFIPLRRSDVVKLCAAQSSKDSQDFVDFCEILLAHLHHDYLGVLNELKDVYAPFNPDRDTLKIGHDVDSAQAAGELLEKFDAILTSANYSRVSRQGLEEALNEISLIPLHTHVEFTDYEDYVFFYRGYSRQSMEIRRYFRKTEIEVDSFQRVAVLLRFKGDEHFISKKVKIEDLNFKPGMAYLFLYKDVPKRDLELLFPNVRVWMTWKDRMLFVGPLLAGLGPMVIKIIPSLGLLAGVIALYTIGPETAHQFDFDEKKHLALWPILVAVLSSSMLLIGFAVRQFLTYKNKKLHFLKRVTETLFFKNIVSNRGVLMTLVDSAEEELGKEMLLAYHHLLEHGPLTREQLDVAVESWLRKYCSREVDFDIGKALHKLSTLAAPVELVSRVDGKWAAKPPVEAKALMDASWDKLYDYAEPST